MVGILEMEDGVERVFLDKDMKSILSTYRFINNQNGAKKNSIQLALKQIDM